VSSLFSLFQVAKFAPWSWCGSATTTIFIFRNNASEQYQRNTDIIPKLFDIVPKAYFLGFSSYQIDNLISCAHFAHLIVIVTWDGSWRPTPKSMGQNGPLISIGTIPKKVVGIVPNIVPHIVPNIVPIALYHSNRSRRKIYIFSEKSCEHKNIY
jgi:hypothetical protein